MQTSKSGNIQRFVNLCSDAGFKAVLCDPANRQLLVALLNIVLPPERRVVELDYATTEIPGVTLSNKTSRVDLRCTSSDRTRFIVEVQRSPQRNFFRRCVYYASRIYSLGSEKGDGQAYELLPVYLVALLDRDFGFDLSDHRWRSRYISRYTFRESETGQVEDETICCIFVELYRFVKGFTECMDEAEQWLWALKNMGQTVELPEALESPELRALFGAGEIAAFDRDKREQYDTDMITERDYENILRYAREQGLEQGEAKGSYEASVRIAGKLLASGMSREEVSALTGLSSEQLADIVL